MAVVMVSVTQVPAVAAPTFHSIVKSKHMPAKKHQQHSNNVMTQGTQCTEDEAL